MARPMLPARVQRECHSFTRLTFSAMAHKFIEDFNPIDKELAIFLLAPGVRDTILGAAAKLAPTGKKGIDSVELTVPERAGQ